VTSKPDFKVMVLLLVFMQLTRDLFAIAKFLLFVEISECELPFSKKLCLKSYLSRLNWFQVHQCLIFILHIFLKAAVNCLLLAEPWMRLYF